MLFFCLEGESGFSGEGSDQQEDAGSHPSHIWGCTAADLHPHAQRLLSTIPQLLCLQITGAGGVTLLVWVIDPRLPPLSFSHSHHPISPHLPPLHNYSRRKYSFFCCGHDWITLFFIFLLTPFSSFIFEGITHCFSVSPEPPQTGTGRHRFENAFFISPPHRHSKRMWQPQYQLLIFTAIFFHANMLCYFYLLTSLVEESWEGLCNNIHWSGLTNLLLPPDPWPVHCLFARIGSLRGRELIGCIVKRGTALFQGVKQIGTQNIYTLFRI